LERLDPDGHVAHEELVADFAALVHAARGDPPGDLRRPIYTYSMVDEDFLLAPVLAAYLATPDGAARGPAFLRRHAAAIRRNLDRVVRLAAPYARDPSWKNLIALQPGVAAGNWRDSDEGLGGGRFPYDVNAALVPAALEAAATLYRGLADEGAAAAAAELAV